jgi:LacI family transcriptional regulator, repressor for deo operon, udp, cdd, tsx, nupC, and nupG
MADIREVAHEAGVSVATVSRVINNNGYVALKTKENVENAIKMLNYKPNLLGRNLRRTETRLILVLLPTIANPFYSKVVKGLEDVAHKNGYNILLCNTDSDNARELMYIELLRNRLADGVIFMAPVIKSTELYRIGKIYPAVQC